MVDNDDECLVMVDNDKWMMILVNVVNPMSEAIPKI